MHLPIPVTVAPNQKLRVTISGTSWGTNDFRIWTTPIGGETSGDFVQNPDVLTCFTGFSVGAGVGDKSVAAPSFTGSAVFHNSVFILAQPFRMTVPLPVRLH